MTIESAINFGLAALNIGVMTWAANNGSNVWFLNLGVAVYCFCMGIYALIYEIRERREQKRMEALKYGRSAI